MKTKKDRRHSGRKTYYVKDNDYPFQETRWDDWSDYRDGLRGSRDRTLIRNRGIGYCKKMGKRLDSDVIKTNKKLRIYSKIRKARKNIYD